MYICTSIKYNNITQFTLEVGGVRKINSEKGSIQDKDSDPVAPKF